MDMYHIYDIFGDQIQKKCIYIFSLFGVQQIQSIRDDAYSNSLVRWALLGKSVTYQYISRLHRHTHTRVSGWFLHFLLGSTEEFSLSLSLSSSIFLEKLSFADAFDCFA